MSNWNELEKQAGADKQYKDYAPKGEYTAKLAEVTLRDKDSWKSPAMEFTWAETEDYKFPRSTTHWLSMGNPAWRAVHNRNILMAFGVEKAKAEQLIDAAEKDQDRAKLVQAYSALYKRMVERGVSAEITVHDQYDRNGNLVKSSSGTPYTETDFKSRSCRMAQTPKTSAAEQMGEAAEDIDLGDIPF